jgi:thiol-disulfide isomerase/thioredoxin
MFSLAGCREAPQGQAPEAGQGPSAQTAPGPSMASQAQAQEPPAQQTSLAPDFLLPDVMGSGEVHLSKLKGKVVLVDFWATWCGPCRMEIPDFIQLQKAYGKKGLRVVGVSLDQAGPELVKRFAQVMKINYKLVMGNAELAGAYGNIEAIPSTFLIGRDGMVVNHYVGFHERAVFEKDIQEALAHPS